MDQGSANDSPRGEKRILTDGKKTRGEKRRKWEAKQARKREEREKEQSRSSWVEDNAHFASLITEKEAERASSRLTLQSNLDSMLVPYLDIQDTSKSPLPNTDSEEKLFVAEGTETVRLLIQQSVEGPKNELKPIQVKSIFVKPSILFEDPVNLLNDVRTCQSIRRGHGKDEQDSGPGFHVLVGTVAALSRVAGFPVPRGAMACGVIPGDRNEAWLDNLIQRRLNKNGSRGIRLLALEGICDTANLGSMVRCASAFGIDAIVLSKDTCNPWYRRSIRVSMGHMFLVPVVRVQNLLDTIRSWTERYPALHSFAAVIDTDASLLGNIDHGTIPSSWCCIMGNESRGISAPVSSSCTQCIRIDMDRGVDSLSVPIACGILLHGLREREATLAKVRGSL